MNTLEKLKSLIRAAMLWDFLNQEYQITIPKSQIQLAEKRKGEKQRHCIALCDSPNAKSRIRLLIHMSPIVSFLSF